MVGEREKPRHARRVPQLGQDDAAGDAKVADAKGATGTIQIRANTQASLNAQYSRSAAGAKRDWSGQ
ncbi:MAG: hypothetical protein OXF50_03055 [Caldilineaceae bacterium]|nr:hypothetical protein [Caldilineaceae bacterium]